MTSFYHNIHKVKTFDVREYDFITGKKVANIDTQKIPCACCGRMIFKANLLSNNDVIGSECLVYLDRLRYQPLNEQFIKAWSMNKKQVKYYKGLTNDKS